MNTTSAPLDRLFLLNFLSALEAERKYPVVTLRSEDNSMSIPLGGGRCTVSAIMKTENGKPCLVITSARTHVPLPHNSLVMKFHPHIEDPRYGEDGLMVMAKETLRGSNGKTYDLTLKSELDDAEIKALDGLEELRRPIRAVAEKLWCYPKAAVDA